MSKGSAFEILFKRSIIKISTSINSKSCHYAEWPLLNCYITELPKALPHKINQLKCKKHFSVSGYGETDKLLFCSKGQCIPTVCPIRPFSEL